VNVDFFERRVKNAAKTERLLSYRSNWTAEEKNGLRNGPHLRRSNRRIFRRVSGADSLLRIAHGQGRQVMNWAYWLSGIATLGIFVYLLIALFKPELFS
jgi:hypothetical protein